METSKEALKNRHPFVQIYYSMKRRDCWLSRQQVENMLKLRPRWKINRGLAYLRQYGLIEHRIRAIKPLKGFTEADVMRKITEGTGKVNTGVIIYEYRLLPATDEHIQDTFTRLEAVSERIINGRKLTNALKVVPHSHRKWNARRKLTPEQIFYIRTNPDNLTDRNFAKFLPVHRTVIRAIMDGRTYKDFNITEFIPNRDEVYDAVREEMRGLQDT